MKIKTERQNRIVSPLLNSFTAHLIIYILSVIFIFWDMLGWQTFPGNALRDRIIVIGCWGVLLFSHYVYSRLSTTIAALQEKIQQQQHRWSSSLFSEDTADQEDEFLAQEDSARRLQK